MNKKIADRQSLTRVDLVAWLIRFSSLGSLYLMSFLPIEYYVWTGVIIVSFMHLERTWMIWSVTNYLYRVKKTHSNRNYIRLNVIKAVDEYSFPFFYAVQIIFVGVLLLYLL